MSVRNRRVHKHNRRVGAGGVRKHWVNLQEGGKEPNVSKKHWVIGARGGEKECVGKH